MRKLIALMLLLLCPALPARALTLPYPEDTILSVMNLTDAQQKLAEFLYEPIFAGREHIDLPEGTLYTDVRPAMISLMTDYPELFHLGNRYTASCYTHEPEYAIYVTPQYIMSSEEAAALRVELYVRAYLMADANPDPEALHDALCEMVTYGGDTYTCHTAVGALLEGAATCEGYAHALTLLYRMAGVPCGIVTGEASDSSDESGPHAWNIAQLECTAFIDVTWNDQERAGFNTHWYYGLTEAQISATHTADQDLLLPPTGISANWHLKHGCLIGDPQDADDALRDLVTGAPVSLRFRDRRLYEEVIQDTGAFISAFNERCPDAAFYSSYGIMKSDAQMCLILQQAE